MMSNLAQYVGRRKSVDFLIHDASEQQDAAGDADIVGDLKTDLRGADTVVVIEDGQISQCGSWEVLKTQSEGRFARLVRAVAAVEGS